MLFSVFFLLFIVVALTWHLFLYLFVLWYYQVRLQPSQYSGKPFCGPQLLGHGSSAKQQLCASQMAHHRLLYPSSPHIPKWQNGRYEAPTLIPCSLGSWAPSPSSLEVLGPKNMPNPQQQQQLFPISSSSPSSRGKR